MRIDSESKTLESMQQQLEVAKSQVAEPTQQMPFKHLDPSEGQETVRSRAQKCYPDMYTYIHDQKRLACPTDGRRSFGHGISPQANSANSCMVHAKTHQAKELHSHEWDKAMAACDKLCSQPEPFCP